MQTSNIAILSLALLGCAHAQINFSGACPSNVPVQCDFNVNEYLGTWYEYAKYPVYFEANGKCVKAEYTLKDNGEVGVTNSMIDENTNETSDIVGYAVPVENAKLKVTFPVSPAIDVSTNYWVLATDYTNYSVVYSCQPGDNNSHYTIVWILTREQVPSTAIIAAAKNVLTKNGISLNDLVVTNQNNCQAVAKGEC